MGVYEFLGICVCLWVPMGIYECDGFLGLCVLRVTWVYGYLWVSWVYMRIIFKHLEYCLFSYSRTPEYLRTSENVRNHICVIKNSVCTTGERGFIDSRVSSTRQ